MVYAPSIGNSSGVSTAGAFSQTTPTMTVRAGSGIYVQVTAYGASAGVSSVTDNQSGVYELLASGSSGTVGNFIFHFVYRRVGGSLLVPVTNAFTVTVVGSLSTVPWELVAIEVQNDGGVDSVSTGSGNGKTESVTGSNTITNDLVLFLGADHLPSSPAFGSGQSSFGYSWSHPTNVTAYGSWQMQTPPGAATSSRTVSTATYWISVGISILPPAPWLGGIGKPFITVSPVGLANSTAPLMANNGADFGPDTPLTSTYGINEAISASATLQDSNGFPAPVPVVLMPGVFSVSQTIHLQAEVPLLGWEAYWRNDATHNTGVRIKPASASTTGFTSNGIGNPALIDTNYLAESAVNGPNILLPSRYIAGISCDSCYNNPATDGAGLTVPIDGIHIDNPDHMTIDHVTMKGFIVNFLTQVVANPAIPGEVEMISCESVADSTNATNQTQYGFRWYGGAGVASPSAPPVGLTNFYLRSLRVITGSGSMAEAFRFENTSKVAAFDIWANGYLTAGIRCHAASLQSANVYKPSSLKFYGVHMNPGSTSVAVTGPPPATFNYTHGTTGSPPATLPAVVSLNLSGVTFSVLQWNGVNISAAQATAGILMRIGDTLKLTYSAGSPTAAYNGTDLAESNDGLGHAALSDPNGMDVWGGEAQGYATTNSSSSSSITIRQKIFDVEGVTGSSGGFQSAAAPANNTAYSNALPFKQQVTISGLTVTQISLLSGVGPSAQSLLSQVSGPATLAITLNPGDQILVLFTGTLSWIWNAI